MSDMLETLNEFNDKLDNLVKRVDIADTVSEQLKKLFRRFRIATITFIVIVCLFLGLNIGLNSRAITRQCESSNALRQGVTQLMGNVLNSSPVPAGPPAGSSQAQVDAYTANLRIRTQFQNDLNSRFQQLKC